MEKSRKAKGLPSTWPKVPLMASAVRMAFCTRRGNWP